ncbi:MAG: DUF4160 domain-containing protein [Deltaproteobacteria bacterium]|nr:DUF4160 domain-containing protein [Deltaproteobacteria bacterium]
MPVISVFYGIIVMLFFMDRKRHKKPHIHVKYQDAEAVFDIKLGKLLEGKLPIGKRRLVEAWMEIHRDELLADWELAVRGQQVFKIDPLK